MAEDDSLPASRAPMSTREVFLQWRKTIARLSGFARGHQRWLALGGVAALTVVGLRLALPMVFRDLLRSTFDDGAPATTLADALALGGAAAVLAALLGFADHLERLWFARFASGLARDVRRAAFQEALADTTNDASGEPSSRGEIAFGLLGDTARVKAGVKGFLVHVATNLALALGVVVVLFVTSPVLGAIFGLTAGLSIVVTAWGAVRVYRASKLARKRESKLADSLHTALVRGTLDARTQKLVERDASLRVTVTKAQGETTWATHTLFGVALFATTLFATDALGRAVLTPSQTLTFFLYALMVRAPIVQLARQGARAGKILAASHRVSRLLRTRADGSAGRARASGVAKGGAEGIDASRVLEMSGDLE